MKSSTSRTASSIDTPMLFSSSSKSVSASAASPGRPPGAWWTAAAVGACWLPLWWRISPAWSANPEQAFGWAVPPLAAYFAWRRRFEARVGAAEPLTGGGRVLAWTALVGGGVVIAGALPVLEPNPLWPAAQWIGATGAAMVTFALLALSGGTATMRAQGFPVVFAFTALSWPSSFQNGLVQVLSQVNAWLAAEAVSWGGLPAVAHGNIIEVGTGLVGVDEACSGLRSLQAVWMLGWFFGELYRFGWAQRLRLVGVAVVAAFVGNLVRTIFLTLQVARGGAAAADRWHDTAGMMVLAVTLAVVAAVAAWWSGRPSILGASTASPGSAVAVASSAGRARALALAVIAALVLAEGATRAWFAWRAPATGAVQWRLADPTGGAQRVSAPARARELLRDPSEDGLAWNDPASAVAAVAFVFRWEGDPALAAAAELHDPTLCLPGVGARLEADLGVTVITVDGLPVPFATYRFATTGGTQHVFFCHWDGFHRRAYQSAGPMTDVIKARLARVWEGRRRANIAHITFVAQGFAEDRAAVAWAREAVFTHLRRLE